MRKFYNVKIKIKPIDSSHCEIFSLTGVCDNPVEGPCIIDASASKWQGEGSGCWYQASGYSCQQLMLNTSTRDMVMDAIKDNYEQEDK